MKEGAVECQDDPHPNPIKGLTTPTQPHLLHPPPDIVKNMIDLILSHICPAKQEPLKSRKIIFI